MTEPTSLPSEPFAQPPTSETSSEESRIEIDDKTNLEEGLSLPPDIKKRLAQVIEPVLRGEDDVRITWISNTSKTRVFSFTDLPSIVFKISTKYERIMWDPKIVTELEAMAAKRFERMVKAFRICRIHNLGLLIVPSAKKIEFEHKDRRYTLMAEQKFEIATTEAEEAEKWLRKSEKHGETIRQLAKFIFETKFDDVTWRNVPFIKKGRIVLIDVEDMSDVACGLFGGDGRPGLMRLGSERQMEQVIEQAKQLGVPIPEDIEKLKQERVDQLEERARLDKFYEAHGVASGAEHIEVDIEKLGLDLNAQETIPTGNWIFSRTKKVSLRQVVEATIEAINASIDQNPSHSRKLKRLVQLRQEPFVRYEKLGGYLPENWMFLILRALRDNGYIYDFSIGNQIQA